MQRFAAVGGRPVAAGSVRADHALRGFLVALLLTSHAGRAFAQGLPSAPPTSPEAPAEPAPPPVVEPPAPPAPPDAAETSVPATPVPAMPVPAVPVPAVPVPAAPVDIAPAPAPPDAAVEVTVKGTSRADRRRQSAEAVTVVELEEAKREPADLGQVLARTEGISVRRSGGLGSQTRFSINGLTDEQIRFFLDGIPLEYQGYTYGVSNVPVNLIDRVDIYAGVVPVRYGADALGGAVDLRTDPATQGTHGSGSYEVGSFGTHRLTASGRHRFEPSGFFTSVNGFFDNARNDYYVDDVLVSSPDGSERAVRAQRFHDHYRGAGGNAELGFVDRPWARRLLARGYYTGFDQEVQSTPTMSIAYGGVTYGERSAGGSLRYENPLGRNLSLTAVAGYAYQRSHFTDDDTCIWNWLGECNMENEPGETDTVPHERITDDNAVYGRFELEIDAGEGHEVRVAFAPTYFTRTGDELYDPLNEFDQLNGARDSLGFVTGVEYEADAFDDRLENVVFAKLYLQRLRNEELVAGGTIPQSDTYVRAGGGDALRLWLTDILYTKASYEYATRLPTAEEALGDNLFIRQPWEGEDLLNPEVSHNGNLSLVVDVPEGRCGTLRSAVNGFVRSIDDLIARLGSDRQTSYQNIGKVRSMGVEGVVDWTSPREYVALGGNVTYMGYTNISEDGPFRDYQGDRIPNRPYLLANASARFKLKDVAVERDELWLSSYAGYVHSFWLGWESIGSEETRSVVPSQLTETLALGYLQRFGETTATATVEAQNLTDAQVYDYFGAQRPGRAFYLKLTVEH